TGAAVPTAFRDVLIESNVVDHIDRTGIRAVVSSWDNRPEGGTPEVVQPWTPSTGVVIRGNRVSNVAGDGIVSSITKDALVEHNPVDGFQLRSQGYNAGMWLWNADGTVFQFNEVSGGRTHRDGMAFDVDQGTDGTVFQYNYSHDNEGGFLLLCNA